MLHYDPLDQHNLTGVFWVFVALGHHHLLHHLITSHVRNVKSVLLRAYLRSAASFQLYRRVQPSNRPKKSVPIGYLHPVISRLYGWDGAALPCVLRDRSAQNSAAARSDWETASSCSRASFTWCCGFIRGGGRWSRLIWTQDDGPVSHWASDRGASRFLPYQMMFSLFRGCYQGSDQ